MAEAKEAQHEQVEDFKRWTAKRKSAVVLDLIKGKTTADDVARKQAANESRDVAWFVTDLGAKQGTWLGVPRGSS